MTVLVALLRGINVGGAGKLPMADLRDIVAGAGYDEIRTYIQSGNVVFRADSGDTAAATDRLRAAIRGATDLDPEVHVRTVQELAAVVDANPFTDRATDPKQLHVSFHADGTADVDLDPAAFEPEAWAEGDRVTYLYLPDGIGRSKLAAQLARGAGATGTSRGWRTVTTLLEMARDVQ